MVNRVYHLDRGFERLEAKLAACGAQIERAEGRSSSGMSGSLLKLMAEDAADLDIIGAAVQDALLRVGDMSYRPQSAPVRGACSIGFAGKQADETGPFERVRAALVVRWRAWREKPQAAPGYRRTRSPRCCRSAFMPDEDPPGGIVRLVLAGGGEIALDVECLDALLIDMGAAWRDAAPA